jgi:acetyl esterase/lipase
MQPLLYRVRRRFGALATDNFFRGISALGKLHPLARPERHKVVVERDVAYRPTGRAAHTLDVYRPAEPSSSGAPRPVAIYAHGGGFRILSKDTHWVMGLVFARAGYVVFNINYELAPRHPFPAAVRDACAAYQWVLGHAQEYGGDPARVVLAGESAGANLATAVAVAASYEREEPFARAIYELGVVPRAVVASCGLLQVSDVERFTRARRLPTFVRDRLDEVSSAYLGAADASAPGGLALADPLCVLERGGPPSRPLPPFFASVGTRDPVLDDTRRLRAALDRLKVECEDRYYPGEPHAFQAVVFRPNARLHWNACFAFLERHVGAG